MGLGTAGLANYANTSLSLAQGLSADGGIGGSSLHASFAQEVDVFDAISFSFAPLGHFFLNLVV